MTGRGYISKDNDSYTLWVDANDLANRSSDYVSMKVNGEPGLYIVSFARAPFL